MTSARPKVTSLDLHLKPGPPPLTKTLELTDVAAGMYPCYYVKNDDHILTSTSAARLISELGDLERNPNFTPPLTTIEPPTDEAKKPLRQRILLTIPKWARSLVPSNLRKRIRQTRLYNPSAQRTQWYDGWDTIDQRVHRLRPFETITPTSQKRSFQPSESLTDRESFIQQSAEHLQRFVDEIERTYPTRQHIVLTGGRDSQLILLTKKKNPSNWNVFSSEPNLKIVKEFIDKNQISINNVHGHDNSLVDNRHEFIKKVLASDLLTDPRHLRWPTLLARLASEYDEEVIFWGGSLGDTINTHFPPYHGASDYFQQHFTRGASWQAISHQTLRNISECPYLSIYHSPTIWREVYRHYDPSMLEPGMDLRPRIADTLYGEPVWFSDENPGPAPVEYPFSVDLIQAYINYIHETQKREGFRLHPDKAPD